MDRHACDHTYPTGVGRCSVSGPICTVRNETRVANRLTKCSACLEIDRIQAEIRTLNQQLEPTFDPPLTVGRRAGVRAEIEDLSEELNNARRALTQNVIQGTVMVTQRNSGTWRGGSAGSSGPSRGGRDPNIQRGKVDQEDRFLGGRQRPYRGRRDMSGDQPRDHGRFGRR